MTVQSLAVSLLAIVLITFLSTGLAGTGRAQMSVAENKTVGPSGLLLPRFVSLASDKANMRTGPGRQYPILWTYVRQGLPLEITAEYGNWRRVRDMDGTQGWMHSALLSGVRTATVTGTIRSLHKKPEHSAPVLMKAEPGVLLHLLRCKAQWCRVDILGRKAWIDRNAIWGTYRGEEVR